jgi:hypothetical protein
VKVLWCVPADARCGPPHVTERTRLQLDQLAVVYTQGTEASAASQQLLQQESPQTPRYQTGSWSTVMIPFQSIHKHVSIYTDLCTDLSKHSTPNALWTRVLQALYFGTALGKGKQYVSAVLVQSPAVDNVGSAAHCH